MSEPGRNEVCFNTRVEEVLRESDGCLVAVWEIATPSGELLDFGVFDPRLDPDDFEYA